MERVHSTFLFVVFVASLALSACGGDSGGTGDVVTGIDALEVGTDPAASDAAPGDAEVPEADAPIGDEATPDLQAADTAEVDAAQDVPAEVADTPEDDTAQDVPAEVADTPEDDAAQDVPAEVADAPEVDTARDAPIEVEETAEDDGVQDLPAPEVALDVTPAGACTNSADSERIGTDPSGIAATARQCGLECMNSGERVPCLTACIEDGSSLSPPCASCFAGEVDCMLRNCLAQCMMDRASETCLGCREQECGGELAACTGLESGR